MKHEKLVNAIIVDIVEADGTIFSSGSNAHVFSYPAKKRLHDTRLVPLWSVEVERALTDTLTEIISDIAYELTVELESRKNEGTL